MIDAEAHFELTRAGTPPRRQVGLRLQLLGTFQVTVAGQVVPDDAWPLRKARSLVKLLALTPGGQMEREELMGLLWPDLAPTAAGNNLRYALHVARRALLPEMIVGEGKTLALYPAGPRWIDVDAFEVAAATARRTHSPADYGAALDLYGGELLPEDRYEDWTAARRDALRDLHLRLLLDLAALHEGGGAWTAAISALQRVLAEESAHEDAHIALMRLYALAGQRGLALRQWDQLAATLRRQLDAVPGEASRALRDEIAAGRFPATTPGEPTFGLRREGSGNNLPVPLTSLIGRETARVEVKEALASARLVTLTGAGGSGKTRLALAVAADLVAAYPDGVWLIDLAVLTDPALIPGSIANVLAVREEPGSTPADRLAAALRDKGLLLVLDNCEHLVAACAGLAERLLGTCSRLRILGTSREALGVPGEVIWRVPSLPLPPTATSLTATAGWETRDLADLGRVAAVRLFIERARQRRTEFILTRENATAVGEICRRLDGIPLALELAAARIGVLTVEQIAARLDDALGTLVARNRTAPSRQQTLRATLDWSYALLTEAERALLRRLAVFAGGWTLAAAEAICGEEAAPSTAPATLDLLEGLTDKSLVIAEQRGEVLRYRMLEIVRQYAAERLAHESGPTGDQEGEDRAIRHAHAAHYLALAEEVEPTLTGPDQGAGFDLLEIEHDNLRAALRWSLTEAADQAETALRLGRALWRFWRVRVYLDEGRRWLAAILGSTPRQIANLTEQRALALARILDGAGVLALAQGDTAAAQAALTECLEIRRAHDDAHGVAHVMISLGYVAAATGKDAEAVAFLNESVARFRALGDTGRLAIALENLGFATLLGGDYPQARAALEEGIALASATGHSWSVASSLNNLGDVLLMQGDAAAALALQAESLGLARAAGTRLGIFWSLEGLARALGAHPVGAHQAARLYGAAETVREAIGYHPLPAKRAFNERHRARAHASLGPAAFESAWNAGRALSLEVAIEEALAATAQANAATASPDDGPRP